MKSPTRRILLLLLVMYYVAGNDLFGQKSMEAGRLETPPVIDGLFEEAVWQGHGPATGFVQMEPTPGEASEGEGLCYLGFDDRAIYLSVRLFQDEDVVAESMSRDGMTKGEDAFIIILDPFNDNRSGFVFGVNPLGTQTDYRINDDGRSVDENWDAEWEAAAVVTDEGWSLEMAIPFSSIRYKGGTGNWGVNFGRVLKASFETSYWSGTMTDDFRISQGGQLTGIVPPDKKGRFTLFPYASLRYENNEFTGINHQVRPDAGLDMKWQVSPGITADATINPDFATVEGDRERVNLTRYELSYPEKRLFFQEGNSLYSTRIKTFYSRRIQDILYGVKGSGKTGKYAFNAMNMRTMENLEEGEPPSFFTTARVKRDFLESSTVGLTAVDRRNDSSSTSSLSGDYVLNLGDTWKLTGQFVGSVSGDLQSHSAWFEGAAMDSLLNHSAWFVRIAKENNYYHMHVRYTELGQNFRENVNKTGYVVDDNRREVDSDLSYTWWLRNSVFEYISVSSKNNVFWARTTGVLRSWYVTESLEAYFQNRFSLAYAYNNEYKLYEKDFYNYQHEIQLGYNTAQWSHASASYSFGHNFDEDFRRFSLGGRVKLTEKLAADYSGDFIRFTPDDRGRSTVMNVISLNYNFTRDLWIRVFAQNSTASERVYIYGMAAWRFRPPFGAIYLVYSHDQEAELLGDPARADALFLKLTFPLTLIR